MDEKLQISQSTLWGWQGFTEGLQRSLIDMADKCESSDPFVAAWLRERAGECRELAALVEEVADAPEERASKEGRCDARY